MMAKRFTVIGAGVVVVVAAIAVSGGVLSAQAGRDVTSNPEQTAYYEPEDSQPTISPDEALAERAKNFPALQLYDTSAPLVDVGPLAVAARAMSTLDGDGTRSDAPVFAASVAYGDLAKYSPGLGADTQIAVDRPVWVLTVHSPLTTSGTLHGSPERTWDVYTVVYDGPTGDGIGYGTGVDIEEIGIPGEYVK
ncbi:hypothetical protein HQQ81_01555 [Microbacteriaceae bacterium VKM Ac-2854]|nr:hypothetical protein [Microbacteriaceae bacterium VKM Ac-2854]